MFGHLKGLQLNRRYEIRDQLGAGGTGLVFTAYDVKLKRNVAVKIVRPKHPWSHELCEKFTSEGRIIARLDHPHILNIFDLNSDTVEGTELVYLVMQYASGGTLADRLEAGGLSPDESERILLQICDALDYAHSRRVIHLDLKPQNILFDEHGNVLVADFGLARLLETTTRIKVETGVGTVRYMSPEQLLGEDAGRFSDIYALGITLYQMLTGELPKPRLGQEGSAIRIERTLPAGVRLIIERATQWEADRRYGAASELAQAFSKILHPPPADLVALRSALRDLGQFNEENPGLGGEEVASYAFQQAGGLFAALGYDQADRDALLARYGSDAMLYAPDGRLVAVIRFTSSNHPVREGLAQLEQRYVASLLPDVGVLCDGHDLWLYQSTDFRLYHTPTLHLHLKDVTEADAQTVYAWLSRRELDLPPPLPASDSAEDLPSPWRPSIWHIGVGLVLLLVSIGLVLLGLGKLGPRQPVSAVLPDASPTAPPMDTPTSAPAPPTITETQTPTPAPTLTPTPTYTPSPTVTPTAIPPTPTPTATPHIRVDQALIVRAAPGNDFEIMGTARPGSRMPLIGRLKDMSWWQLDYLGRAGWIPAQPAGASVAPTLLPVVTPPVLPTVTPTPTATPACPTLPTGTFWDMWREELTQSRMGCPLNQASLTGSARARFERGWMYWREDQHLIYVFYEDGRWKEFLDTWVEGGPVSGGYTPPLDLLEPIRGFGKIWREQLGGPEAEIGWAIENEIGGDTVIQDFEGGVILEIETTIYLLYRDNMTWQRYSPGIGVPTGSPSSASSSSHIAFVKGFLDQADIWLIGADGSNIQLLVGDEREQSEPDWSPDGQHIAYQSDQSGNYDIWVISADGQNTRQLTWASVDEREPDWSPDGLQIVYRRGGEHNRDGELWVMGADGGNQHPLAAEQIMGRAPVWSPTASQVAFMSERSGTWNIFVLDLATEAVRQLTDCSSHCRFPVWSLDGQYIAYNVTASAGDYSPLQIWHTRADGRGEPQILIDGNNPGRPAWSVEGLVAFNTPEHIELMNADGSGRHKLPGSDDGWAPDWSR